MCIMGGRGAFKNVSSKDFTFVENGQTYFKVAEIDGVEILVRKGNVSVKAPEYSHSANKIYATLQNGKLKHLSFYDENHKQFKSIDFMHEHGTNHVKPHVHFGMQHIKDEKGTPPSRADYEIIDKINDWIRSK